MNFSLRVVLKGEGGEAEILEASRVQEVDNSSAVDGVPGQPVGVPGDDALGLASLNAFDHLAEELPPRCLGAERLFVDAHDFNIAPRRNQALHLAAL